MACDGSRTLSLKMGLPVCAGDLVLDVTGLRGPAISKPGNEGIEPDLVPWSRRAPRQKLTV